MSEERRTENLNAPYFDCIIDRFRNQYLNPEQPSAALMAAVAPLFRLLGPLKPCQENDEAKILWIIVPRGTSDDWESFEDAQDYEDVKTHEEYLQRWKEYYPDEYKWYLLGISENKPDDTRYKFRTVVIDNSCAVNVDRTNDEGKAPSSP